MATVEVACRSCARPGLEEIINLGEMPLANSLLSVSQLQAPEPRYPLRLVFCSECSLVQITETVPPEKLFGEYLYFSSYSDTMVAHARDLAFRTVASRHLGQADLVIELASNDGYLLQFYRQLGIPVLGIEPAKNIAAIAQEERGIPTICDFFGLALALRLRERGKRAAVLHAHNVLAHVADLNGFVQGVETLLADDGIAIIEVPYVVDMIDGCEFDTIYHEHLCYFSLTAIDALVRRHGLAVIDVERVPIHGGSLRATVAKAGARPLRATASSVEALLGQEYKRGMTRRDPYVRFSEHVDTITRELQLLLSTIKAGGKRVAAYGAAAKGSTLLNFAGLGSETIEYVVDRSPHKQGLFTPGSHLPILAPEKLVMDMPDYVLLLAWNLADEILRQEQEYTIRGGHFIIPVPNMRVV